MPLIIICGMPSTGKTTRTKEIEQYFTKHTNKKVHVISDNEILRSKEFNKNILYFDSQKEKELRGVLKSEALRLLKQDDLVILDAGNYIKGYRYELYCATKNSKNTQLTIETVINQELAWQWNCDRQDNELYTKETFDALNFRYEAPDNRNRWDNPLINLNVNDKIDGQLITQLLYERKPPPPNHSTQSAPLSDTNFLYELDRVTQEIVNDILSAKKMGNTNTSITLKDHVLHNVPENISPAILARLRRQFLNYQKLHPPLKSTGYKSIQTPSLLFIQFLNTSLKNL